MGQISFQGNCLRSLYINQNSNKEVSCLPPATGQLPQLPALLIGEIGTLVTFCWTTSLYVKKLSSKMSRGSQFHQSITYTISHEQPFRIRYFSMYVVWIFGYVYGAAVNIFHELYLLIHIIYRSSNSSPQIPLFLRFEKGPMSLTFRQAKVRPSQLAEIDEYDTVHYVETHQLSYFWYA